MGTRTAMIQIWPTIQDMDFLPPVCIGLHNERKPLDAHDPHAAAGTQIFGRSGLPYLTLHSHSADVSVPINHLGTVSDHVFRAAYDRALTRFRDKSHHHNEISGANHGKGADQRR